MLQTVARYRSFAISLLTVKNCLVDIPFDFHVSKRKQSWVGLYLIYANEGRESSRSVFRNSEVRSIFVGIKLDGKQGYCAEYKVKNCRNIPWQPLLYLIRKSKKIASNLASNS